MNEDDLRDCFAMFKSISGATADECYEFADAMLEARKNKEVVSEVEDGIVAIKPKRRSK